MELASKLLVAAPSLVDPNFSRSVILLLQHDQDGAIGLILDRPTEEPVADHLPQLDGWTVEPAVVFVGGPVDPTVAIGLEQNPHPDHAIPGAPWVGILDLTDREPAAHCRVFSGYSGWGPGQLEEEITEGAWIIVDPAPDDVFSGTPDGLWSRVLRRQGGRLSMLSTFPPDPSLN